MIKRGARKMAPQKSQGSTSWSLVWLVRDSQGVLPSRRLGVVSDGHHRGTLSPHVLIQGRSIEETLGVTTSTDELEVKVLPHVAESCVGVLTESELPVPPFEVKRLPHEATGTPCPYLHGTQEVQQLSSSVHLGWEKMIKQREGTSVNPHGCTEGSSLLGQ